MAHNKDEFGTKNNNNMLEILVLVCLFMFFVHNGKFSVFLSG